MNKTSYVVVIPTYNRHQYLDRISKYYAYYNIKVLIVDSTAHAYEGILPNGISYRHTPNLKFHQKILLACECLDSEYIALCPDDDFLLPDILKSKYLEMINAPDISIGFGRFLGFNKGRPGQYRIRGAKLPIAKLTDNRYLNISRFMKRYMQVLWSLYRKDILAKSFQIIGKANFTNDNYIELTIAAISIYFGKMSISNQFWGVREISPDDHWGSRHPSINYLNQTDKEIFLKEVGHATSDEYAKLAIESYISPSKPNGLFERYRQRVKVYQRTPEILTQSLELDVINNILTENVKY